jgi:hypothetical protein
MTYTSPLSFIRRGAGGEVILPQLHRNPEIILRNYCVFMAITSPRPDGHPSRQVHRPWEPSAVATTGGTPARRCSPQRTGSPY